ncbi:MAG TPA: MATE family efflux transporter [Cytophagaceae bacterium]|jgi:MATE family multidrug resistance protein|nr:MATE family efflux transporter [Cytophagaceae bacterium]
MFSKDYVRHYKEHIILSLPVAVSQLGHIVVGMVDTIKAGSIGSSSLASAAIATSVFIPFLMLGIGISYGATSLIAKADGAGDKEEIRTIFKHSLALNFILSICLFLLLYNCSFVLRLLQQPKEVVDASIPFAEWLAWSILPLMLFQTFKQFAEGLSYTRGAMVISIASVLVNIVLIYIFTDGWFGITPMGLNGIAIATLVARSLMAVAMMLLVLTNKSFNIYIKGFTKISYQFNKFKDLLWISLPIGLQMVFESGAFGFAAIMVGWLGAGEIAAHQIALTMAAFTYMGATGIAASATVRVGNELGKKDYIQLRKAGYSAMILVFGYMAITATLFVLFRFYLPTLFIKEPEVIQMISSLLLIAAFFQLSDGIQVVGFGALRGMGDVIIPTTAVLVAYYVIGLPLGYWLAFNRQVGIEGVWYGLSLGLIFVSVFLFLRFRIKAGKLIHSAKKTT